MKDFESLREELAKKDEAQYLEAGGPVIGSWYEGKSEYRSMDEEGLVEHLRANFISLCEKGMITQGMLDEYGDFFFQYDFPLNAEAAISAQKEAEALKRWRIRVGLQLGDARKDQGKSMQEIAPLLGMSVEELLDFEYGRKDVSLDAVIKYAYIIGVKVTIDPKE